MPFLVGLIVVLALLGGLLVAWQYRREVAWQNWLHATVFRLTESGHRKLLLLGDSRLAALKCPVEFKGWRVLNLAVPGLTSRQVERSMVELSGRLPDFQRAVLWVGINDIVNHGATPGTVLASTDGILDRLTPVAAQTLVIEQIPIGPGIDAARAERFNAAVDEVNAGLRREKTRSGVLLLAPFSPDHHDIYEDGLHLNSAGNRLLCKALGDWLANNDS